MNKKLTRKLTLSAVTLGVAALSLTSTTYAWFTTNGSATASGITGEVAASDANMLIKTPTNDNENTNKSGQAIWGETFTKSASLKQAFNYSSTSKSTLSMQPVTWNSTQGTEKFQKASDTVGNFETDAVMNEDILHYEVIFAITDLQKGAKKNVSVSFADLVKDSTKSSGTQYLLVDALSIDSNNKATAGKTIEVSILDVLSLRVESTVIKSSSTSGELKIGDYNITDTGSTLIDSITSTDANYRYKKEVDTLTEKDQTADQLKGNAIDYYKNVYGDSASSVSAPTDPDTRGYVNSGTDSEKFFGGADGITLFTVKGTDTAHTVYVKTDFYFYIDGWDNQCFNCVGGLSLGNSGSMTFKCETQA